MGCRLLCSGVAEAQEQGLGGLGVGTSAGAQNPPRKDPLGKSWPPSRGGSQRNQSFHRPKSNNQAQKCGKQQGQCPWLPLPAGPAPVPAHPAPGLEPLQHLGKVLTPVLLPEMPGFYICLQNAWVLKCSS